MRIHRQAKRITIRGQTNTGTGVSQYLSARAGPISANMHAGTNVGRVAHLVSNAVLGYQSTAFTVKPGPSAPTTRDKPITANEWVQRHLDKVLQLRGKWVAISNNGIVATSDDFDEVFNKARGKGVSTPLVFKVPSAAQGIRAVSGKLG